MSASDWNPSRYGQFKGQRLRPALDLLSRIGELPEGDVVDLGCGAGAVGPALRARFPERRIIGVDTSPAMLAQAAETGAYDALIEGDAADWEPERPVALIVSNAALHWVGNHSRLMPRLSGLVMSGGCLAVQMPHQNRAPSHRFWLDLAEQLFPGRIPADSIPGIDEPVDYVNALSGQGAFALWETEYFQILPASDSGHPVRHFTSSTFARPILNALEAEEAERLVSRYDAAVASAYPRRGDGTVLFPFRRLFFMLEKFAI